MIALLLAILGNTGFGLIVKAADRRGGNLLAVGVINYAVAASIYGFATRSAAPPQSTTVLLGICGGFFFSSAFFVLSRLLRARGVSISAAVLQLSVLFPVLAGVFVWEERTNWAQNTGIVLSLLALPLLSIDRTGPTRRVEMVGLLLSCGLLILAGCAQLTMHSFHHLSVAVDRGYLFRYIFGTAIGFSALFWLLAERRAAWCDVPYGVVLGVVNCMGGYMLISAMQSLPGMVVFPISGATSLLLTVLVARYVWREQLGPYARIGMAVTAVAVACINAMR